MDAGASLREPLIGMSQDHQPDDRSLPSGFVVRVAVFYGAAFLLIGVFLPYFPVWLDWRGLGSSQIALVLAAPPLVRIVFVPTIAFAADRIGDRRLVLIALGWSTLLSCGLLAIVSGFWAILAATTVFSLCWSAVMPLSEALAMSGVRRSGIDYGRMRLWGSLTFIAATVGGGFAIQAWQAPAALWLLAAAALATAVAAHLLPAPTGKGLLRAAAAMPRVRLRDALRLARAPLFVLFLLTAGLVQAGHAVYYAFGTLHWQAAGLSTGVIGTLWMVGVVAEIALFAVSRRAVALVGPVALLALAGLAGIVRWSITALDPPLALLFAVQALHGLTFGAGHLGAVHFIAAAVPEDYAATAQGLYASITAGLIMGAAVMAAGPLYARLGADAYFAMAGFGAVAMIGAWQLARGWRDRRLLAAPAR